jgi:hypothetical protein
MMMGEVSTIGGAENGVCVNFRKRVLWVFIDTVIYIFPLLKGNHSTKSEKGIKYSQFGIKLERTYECEIPLIRNHAGRSVGYQEVVVGPLLELPFSYCTKEAPRERPFVADSRT